jgi:hypothetical protein
VKPKVLILAMLAVGSLTVSNSVWAHHAAGAVYESKSITLKGTVTGFEWSNPHSIVSFEVTDDKGDAEQWHAEVVAPAEMTRAGWTRDTIKPGDQVTLTGRPGKNAQHIMWLQYLVTPDGRKLGRTP